MATKMRSQIEGVADDGTVACLGCGQVHEPATQMVAQLREDLDNANHELAAKRRQIKALKRDQDTELRASPHYEAAMRVLEQWRAFCAPGAKELGGKRLSLVIDRLKGGSPEAELIASVIGYSQFPYVASGKGRVAHGSERDWHADAEFIFRSPANVDQGLRLAQRSDPSRIDDLPVERISWRRVQRANREAIVAFLRKRFGTQGVELEGGYLELPCPRCHQQGRDTWLMVAPIGLGYVAQCSVCGLTDDRLLEVMRTLEATA